MIILVDTTEINRIVREIVRREQQNAQTLNILSAKVKDPDIARQLREIATREQQTADGLAQVSYIINNESAYAGTGFLNKTGNAAADGETGAALGSDYTEVLTNYDGSGKVD